MIQAWRRVFLNCPSYKERTLTDGTKIVNNALIRSTKDEALKEKYIDTLVMVYETRIQSPEWHRCIGLRKSHDKSLAVGLSAGIAVCVCTNLAFGGTTVVKRRHTSGIVLSELIDRAVASLEDDFLTTETVCEDLKDAYLKNDDEARSSIVRAAELGVINSSDILPVYREFKEPSHIEFRAPTRWSLMNAMSEIVKKYSPQRVDNSYRALNRAFGLDGRPAAIFA